MDFSPSSRAADLAARVRTFVDTEIEPIEHDYHREITRLRESGGDPWTPLPVVEELKAKARAQGLWNLFLPAGHEGDYARRFGTDGGTGLTNLDYAPVAEETGRSFLAPLVLNCNAPDTGNMEVLLKYGTGTADGSLVAVYDAIWEEATSRVVTALGLADGDRRVVHAWWAYVEDHALSWSELPSSRRTTSLDGLVTHCCAALDALVATGGV